MERIDKDFTESKNQESKDTMMQEWERRHRKGKFFGGMIIVAIGSIFLAREMGMDIPRWIFSWKVLLITIGFFIGLKQSFRVGGWLVPIFIGVVFLLRDNFPQLAISHYVWPLAIIIVGLVIMFKPRRSNCRNHNRWNRYHNWQQRNDEWQQTDEKKSSDNYLELNVVFGSIEKNIISKDFKGGEINTVFGGAEINLSQADINGRVELEINTVFGGTKLIVPPHWEVKSDVTAVLGSVEDKRMVRKDLSANSDKVLILRGSAVFGGIDIQSY